MKCRRPSLFKLTIPCLALAISTGLMSARADDPAEPTRIRPVSTTPPANNVTILLPSEVTATPQMWFYEQSMARYNDPKTAIRAAAEFKSNQRRMRMAAMDWYGYSNSRPAMGIDPVDGPTQAQWIGNGYDPTSWVAPRTAVWVIPGVSSGY